MFTYLGQFSFLWDIVAYSVPCISTSDSWLDRKLQCDRRGFILSLLYPRLLTVSHLYSNLHPVSMKTAHWIWFKIVTRGCFLSSWAVVFFQAVYYIFSSVTCNDRERKADTQTRDFICFPTERLTSPRSMHRMKLLFLLSFVAVGKLFMLLFLVLTPSPLPPISVVHMEQGSWQVWRQ